MVKEICKLLRTRYERSTLTIRIPECFDHLKGEDANFETVTSNTIRTTHLCYAHNVVTDSIAYIFVNEECNRFAEMTDAERKAEFSRDMEQNIGMTVEEAVSAEMMTEEDVLEAIADFCRPVPWEDAKISGDQAY